MLPLLPSSVSIPQPLTRRQEQKTQKNHTHHNTCNKRAKRLECASYTCNRDPRWSHMNKIFLSSRAHFQLVTQQLRYLLPHRSPHCFTGQNMVDLKSHMSYISEQNYIWALICPLCLVPACGQVFFIWQEVGLQETDHNQYLVEHILLVKLLLLAGSHSSLTHTVIWLVGRPAPAVYLEAEHHSDRRAACR